MESCRDSCRSEAADDQPHDASFVPEGDRPLPSPPPPEAEPPIDDAVREVQATSTLLLECVRASLPQLHAAANDGGGGGGGANMAHGLRLLDAVDEAVFAAHAAPLRRLYRPLVSEGDAAYRASLVELRRLLPQHIGVRPALWLRVARPSPAELAAQRRAMWAWRPAAPEAGAAEAAAAAAVEVVGPAGPALEAARRAARLHARRDGRAAWLVQRAWRCWHGGPYVKSVTTLRLLSLQASPLQKAECVLGCLNNLALEAADRLRAKDAAAEVAADELLPLLVFVLVRARAPLLSSEVRLMADFLPRPFTLGGHGYALATLQAALQYVIQTSWASIEHEIDEVEQRARESKIAALAAAAAETRTPPLQRLPTEIEEMIDYSARAEHAEGVARELGRLQAEYEAGWVPRELLPSVRRNVYSSVGLNVSFSQPHLGGGRNRTTSGASTTANGIFSSVASRPRTGTWSQQGDADYLG